MKQNIYKSLIVTFLLLLAHLGYAAQTTSITIQNGNTETTSSQKVAATFKKAGGTLIIDGNVKLSNLSIYNLYGISKIVVNQGSTLNVDINEWNDNSLSIINNGTITGTIKSNSDIVNNGTMDLTNYKVRSSGSLENSGTLLVSRNLTNDGVLTNNGVLSVTGNITNGWSATLTNTNTLSTTGNLTNRNTLTNSGDITVKGSLTHEWNRIFTNSGTISSDGNMDIYGPVTSSGTITSGGSISVRQPMTLQNGAALTSVDLYFVKPITGTGSNSTITATGTTTTNNGAALNGALIVNINISDAERAKTVIESSVVMVNDNNAISIQNNTTYTQTTDYEGEAEFVNLGGTLVINSNVTLTSLITSGLYNSGVANIIVNSGKTLIIDAAVSAEIKLTNNGTVINNGNLSISGGLTNKGVITNNGVIDVEGSITNDWGAILNNTNSLSSSANFTNNSTLTNSGVISVASDFVHQWQAEFTNSGNLTSAGNMDIQGVVTNSGAITSEGSISVSNPMILQDGATLTSVDLYFVKPITGTGSSSTITATGTTTTNNGAALNGALIVDVNISDAERAKTVIESSVVMVNDVVAPPSGSSSNSVVTFDGTKTYMKVANHSDINLEAQGTLEISVKLSAYSDYAGLMHKGDQTNFSDEAYTLQMGGSGFDANNKQVMFAVNENNYNYSLVASTTELDLGKWYHIVATWDATYLYLYINGVLENKVSLTFVPRVTSGDLIIGNQFEVNQWWGSEYYPFEGQMDNVRIWNKSMTQEEAWASFGTAASASDASLKLNLDFETLSNDESYFESVSVNKLKAYIYNFTDRQAGTTIVDQVAEEVIFDTTPDPLPNTVYEYIIVAADETLTLSNDVECDNLILNASSQLIIPAGITMTINNDLFIKSTSATCGQMFVDGGLVITGTVHVEHAFKGDGSWEFLTVPAELTDFSLLGTTFNDDYAVYYYSEAERAANGPTSSVWKVPSVLTPGVGYIFAFANPKSILFEISGATYLSAATEDISLSFNTGNILQSGWNLVGNPFQTTVSWDKVITALENDVFIDESVGAAIYVYDSSTGNYLTYVDGLSTDPSVDGMIRPFDAFFVKAYDANKKFKIKRNSFPNPLELKGSEMDNRKKFTAVLKNEKSVDETVIRFSETGSDEVNIKQDAYKQFADRKICQIYTKSSDKKEIAVKTLSSDESSKEIDLFIKCPEVGDYEIHFKDMVAFESDDLYLIDKLNGNYVDLNKEQSYSFNTDKSGSIDRFMVVLRTAETVTSTSDYADISALFYYNNEIKVINNQKAGVLTIVDLNGHVLFSKSVNTGDLSFSLQLTPGVYVLSLNGDNKKIVVE